MKQAFILLIFTFLSFISSAQQKTVYGDLRASDSISLNIIKVVPDSFPTVSIIFEAVKNNDPVFGLTKDLVVVTENSQSCKILKLKQIEDEYPINISLVIDHSGSMMDDPVQLIDSASGVYLLSWVYKNGAYFPQYPEGYVPPIENAKKAVTEFIKKISATKDSIQIVGFSTTVDIYSSFSNNKKYLQSITDSLHSNGSTAFLDAINFALDSISQHSGIKVIIALTDGLDNSSHIKSKELIKKAKELKIPIYTVGLGNVDKKFLTEISKGTGGGFYYTKTSNSLTTIYKEIQERIHAIYDLQYVSENLNPNDTTRQIKVAFKVDTIYLGNNLTELNLSSKTIQYINDKITKQRYKTIGWSIAGISLTSGIIIFYYRRKKKKSN